MTNLVILVGRIARDPETRATQSGTKITQVSVATDRPARKEGKTFKDENGYTVNVQLLHQACPMHFHRARRTPEIVSDGLVGISFRQPFQYFLLARGEGSNPGARLPFLQLAGASALQARECPLKRFEQGRLFEGLFKKLDGSGLHRLDRCGYIAMAGQNDDRHGNAALCHRSLDFQAIHVGHPDI